MAFYGWICLIALPVLVYLWLEERAEAASIRRIRKGGDV